jgi:hypothetical protein
MREHYFSSAVEAYILDGKSFARTFLVEYYDGVFFSMSIFILTQFVVQLLITVRYTKPEDEPFISCQFDLKLQLQS